MPQGDRFTVINIRDCLKKNDGGEEQFGEDGLRQILSLRPPSYLGLLRGRIPNGRKFR